MYDKTKNGANRKMTVDKFLRKFECPLNYIQKGIISSQNSMVKVY